MIRRLTRIELQGYKTFAANTNIEYGDVTCIVGPNGSGKTNILESISLFEKGRGFRKDHLKNMINNNNQDKMFIINSNFIAKENNLDLILSCTSNEEKLKKKNISKWK